LRSCLFSGSLQHHKGGRRIILTRAKDTSESLHKSCLGIKLRFLLPQKPLAYKGAAPTTFPASNIIIAGKYLI
jgi:hypothetical protein